MKLIDIKNFLSQTGSVWTEDRFGHFNYKSTVVTAEGPEEVAYRLKIQATSIRFERKVVICGKSEWRKMRSDYCKNIVISNDKDLLIGGLRVPVIAKKG